MPAVAGKLEHKLATSLHRLTVHCIYRKVFTTKNVKASYGIDGNANKREMFSRKRKGRTSNLASPQHSSHKEKSTYKQFMKMLTPFMICFFPVLVLTTYCFLSSVNTN